MSGLFLQVLIVVAFGAFCFGCGYLTAFIVTRNRWRDEMIKRGVARTTGRPANGNGESRRKNRDIECPAAVYGFRKSSGSFAMFAAIRCCLLALSGRSVTGR